MKIFKNTDIFPKKHLRENRAHSVFNQSREAVAQRCSIKKAFLEISQNSQENTSARASLF